MAIERISTQRCFGGEQIVFAHESQTTGTKMQFAAYLPPQAEARPVPVLFYLAGLGCNHETGAIKAGAQRTAAELGLAVVMPDTSPRGLDLPGEHDDGDFGSGAGFYIDATEHPWNQHYRMESYIVRELRELVQGELPLRGEAVGIFGHSMGGHGALTLALKYPELFRSASAFAPICAPTRCPWGEKAFSHYLGNDRSRWAAHDAAELVQAKPTAHRFLVDQGLDDPFLERELKPDLLEEACRAAGQTLNLRRHSGYDHSYWFVQTFVEDHLRHHAAILGPSGPTH